MWIHSIREKKFGWVHRTIIHARSGDHTGTIFNMNFNNINSNTCHIQSHLGKHYHSRLLNGTITMRFTSYLASHRALGIWTVSGAKFANGICYYLHHYCVIPSPDQEHPGDSAGNTPPYGCYFLFRLNGTSRHSNCGEGSLIMQH